MDYPPFKAHPPFHLVGSLKLNLTLGFPKTIIFPPTPHHSKSFSSAPKNHPIPKVRSSLEPVFFSAPSPPRGIVPDPSSPPSHILSPTPYSLQGHIFSPTHLFPREHLFLKPHHVSLGLHFPEPLSIRDTSFPWGTSFAQPYHFPRSIFSSATIHLQGHIFSLTHFLLREHLLLGPHHFLQPTFSLGNIFFFL